MKRFRLFTVLIFTFSLVFSNFQPVLAVPCFPHSFFGTVKINGANVSPGTTTYGKINGVTYGTSAYLTDAGQTVYTMGVTCDDPDEAGITGGVNGDTVVFFIGGTQATQTFTFQSGANTNLNLTATVNVAPVITESDPKAVTMSEDGSPIAFSLTLNATDGNAGDTLTWSISTAALHGTASASGTGLSKAIGYTPTANWNTTDSFVVRVSDGSLADTITVNVTINAVNDAPVITEGTSTIVNMSVDGSPTPFSLTLHATDVDTADTITWSISSPSSNGTASASGTGTSKVIGYTPNSGWSGSDSFIVQVSDGNGGTDTITVNVNVQAPSYYTLSVNKSGTGTGTVTSNPAGINCGADCSEDYLENTVVTLTATADSGSTFTGWSGSCSGMGTCNVTMSAARSVTANFNIPASTYTLTVNKSGTGTGTVTSSPAGINCGADCSEVYNANSSVTLTATPNSGSTFTGWSGACSGTGTCNLTMNANKSVTANFSTGGQVFNDVPLDYSETLGGVEYLLYPYIQALYEAGLTAGTSANPPLYSPTMILNRAMAAVFMLRGSFGNGYAPPDPPWNTFLADDWSLNSWAQGWAEGMWNAGLTAGCQSNPLKYCPDQTLPRVQAVIFGLHMKYDYFSQGNLVSYTPPPATGTVFADLTDPGFYGTAWAEQAYRDGLLPICGSQGGKPLFCPNDPVNRAWAAYLIVQAKGLLATGSGIYGTVTDGGSPAGDVSLDLRFYNGSTWSDLASTTTAADGSYSFTGAPSLGSNQYYYVNYSNPENDNGRLLWWQTRFLDSYSVGSAVNIDDFDVADIQLVLHSSTITLPYNFRWQRRSASPSDSYEFNLFDPNDHDPWWWTDPSLGYVDHYNLTSKPAGFGNGIQYGWCMWVYDGSGGVGSTYYYQPVKFSAGSPGSYLTAPARTGRFLQDLPFPDNGNSE
jgi:hypothetical protein